MKAVMCGIGKEARHYFNQYEVRSDVIACMVDERPNWENLPKGMESIPFITWNDLSSCDVYDKAEYRFVICSGKYYNEILNSIKRIVGEPINVISLDEYVHIENWRKLKNQELDLILQNVKHIHAKCLGKARVLSKREDALLEIPTGGISAEIGVATGYFSRKILDVMRPEKFYAVDIFSDETEIFWNIHFSEKRHFEWYREAFSKDIESGVLEMKRGLSWDVIAEFPDDYFDYVYLDAAHDYSSVKKDIKALVPKVKNGGIIQFNDYTIYDYNASVPYGVVPAVNKLVNDTGSEVLYYCLSTHGFDDIVIKLRK